ncbi:hypothetical protein TNCV_4980621 [Trichonephila clavipes]|nr:hypothetical protein TNCV_4980621 [Trichonephila clavipes]
MNSPDYEDFIDMFSLPTPISPLPPTPIASPSHEASEDVIYDALPPWSNLPFRITFEGFHGTIYRFRITFGKNPFGSPKVSKSPDPPVKKAHVKKDSFRDSSFFAIQERWHERRKNRRNEKHWHEEPRPRDPRLYKRLHFRPPYVQGILSNPEGFKDPVCTAIDAHSQFGRVAY